MKIFHIFACTKEREGGSLCGWPKRVREGRVPREPDGTRAREIEDFCKRCRRQGRAMEGEKSIFCFVRRENEHRRIVEDVVLA